MSSEPERVADFWEQLAATSFYRSLTAKTVDQYFSGEVGGAFITYDLGKWWLKVDGVVGEDPYDTLEAAKSAGDAIVQKSDLNMAGAMLTSLGLPLDEWKFEIVHGMPVLTSLTHEEITLSAGETSPRWLLQQGNDFVIETDDFSEALARAKDRITGPGSRL